MSRSWLGTTVVRFLCAIAFFVATPTLFPQYCSEVALKGRTITSLDLGSGLHVAIGGDYRMSIRKVHVKWHRGTER